MIDNGSEEEGTSDQKPNQPIQNLSDLSVGMTPTPAEQSTDPTPESSSTNPELSKEYDSDISFYTDKEPLPDPTPPRRDPSPPPNPMSETAPTHDHGSNSVIGEILEFKGKRKPKHSFRTAKSTFD